MDKPRLDMKSGVRPGLVPCFAILVLPLSSSSGTLSELKVPPLENVCDVIPASWDAGRRR